MPLIYKKTAVFQIVSPFKHTLNMSLTDSVVLLRFHANFFYNQKFKS